MLWCLSGSHVLADRYVLSAAVGHGCDVALRGVPGSATMITASSPPSGVATELARKLCRRLPGSCKIGQSAILCEAMYRLIVLITAFADRPVSFTFILLEQFVRLE